MLKRNYYIITVTLIVLISGSILTFCIWNNDLPKRYPARARQVMLVQNYF